MKDCHIHLQRDYSKENIDIIVDIALKNDLKEIWLLEHTYIFEEYLNLYDYLGEKNEVWFNKKISNSKKVSDYHDLITEVRRRSYPITIKFGLEVCYKKEKEELIKEISKSFNYDFLIGSIHYVDNFAFAREEYIDSYKKYDIDMLYKEYFESTIDLIKSKLFNLVAHPDLIKVRGYKPSFDLKPYYKKIASVAFENNVALEQNSGINRNNNCELGMNKEFLNIVLAKSVEIKTSSDAHENKAIGYKVNTMYKEIEQIKGGYNE